MARWILLLIGAFSFLSCTPSEEVPQEPYDYWKDYPGFESLYSLMGLEKDTRFDPDYKSLDTNTLVPEVSGLTASVQQPGYGWMIGDSGNDPFLFLVNLHAGNIVCSYEIPGLQNTDWEDIESYEDESGKGFLLIGDIGDNAKKRSAVAVYRVAEPIYTFADSGLHRVFNSKVEKKALVYPKGARDSEALFRDPIRGDIYLISKTGDRDELYGFSWGKADTLELNLCGKFPFPYTTAANTSLDGKHVVIRTYSYLLIWDLKAGFDFRDQLGEEPLDLPYHQQTIQGESICLTETGYFIISEEAFGVPSVLYHYRYY